MNLGTIGWIPGTCFCRVAGQPIALTPKVFDTLLLLVKRSGEVLEKEELLRAIWPDTIVEENNLNQNISTLRRILGESRGENRYIATVPGQRLPLHSRGANRFAKVIGAAPRGEDRRVAF